jgi:hypothetical protein
MTPAIVLDKLLPRWRSKLPARYSSDFIDGFIARNRAALETVVDRAMMLRRVKQGEPPRTAEEFAAYAKLVERERPKDQEPDDQVVKRIAARHEKMKVRGRVSPDSAAWLYIEARAKAIMLRQAGWDIVPLLLREPALAVLVGEKVGAVVDVEGDLFFAAGFADKERLGTDLEAAHRRVLAINTEIGASIGGGQLGRFAFALWSRARGKAAQAPTVASFEPPADLQSKPWRTEANLKAMRLVLTTAPGEFTGRDLEVLAQYSGWGGLSIEAVKQKIPKELVPETFGLIHEYYTPTLIADSIAAALCPMLPELAGNDGVVRALEPSAGIGRLIRAFSPQRCLHLEAGGQLKKLEWTAVEFSKVSSTLLRALRPDVDLHNMPFERWVNQEGRRYRGTIGLVVSNPPYGERGAMAREDTDDFYKEKRAFAYFMRRTLDLLVPGGVGVFLIPAGFLSGTLNRGLREKLLVRHHLLGAFRLPSHDKKGHETVPGASVVMDMVFWRSRGGELTQVDEADQFIVDGDYFAHEKSHVLGKEDGSFAGDDEAGVARSWRYRVTGEFKGLPPLEPRPVCSACVLGRVTVREDVGTFQSVSMDDAIPADIDEELRPALELGRRVGRYLAIVGADEADKAAQLWPELRAALGDFSDVAGNPWRDKAIRELAEGPRKVTAAQQLLGAFEKTGGLTLALREAPRIVPKFTGQPDDVLAQAQSLFRQQRELTLPQLLAFHRQQGGSLSDAAALAALLAADWNLDGDAWNELLPSDAYLTGSDLWARHDRANARAAAGDEQARVQVRRLLGAIRPATFDDLAEISPRHGYVPLEMVAAWISATLNGRYGAVRLERKGGLVQILGHEYTDADLPPIAPETLAFLGFYNHDPELFRPAQERDRDAGPTTREERAAKKQNLAERRIALAKKWDESFKSWLAADPDRREQFMHAYNRVARGRVVPSYSAEPLDIARWGPQSPKLKPHQVAGARRVLAQRGGLVAFDVGVGKTYTALAIIARARQEGWVRRPVILVPSSLVWKWHDDVLCTLPDYRLAVIGSKRKQISRGARRGFITSETDTPEERAKKWTMLQTGQVDVVILSYDALARTKMNEDKVLAYVNQVEAVERSIALRKRTLEEKVKNAKQKETLSERDRALLEHGVRAWVDEILALPNDWEYDPGVAWDDIGIDMLVIDEAAAFKNLHKPQAREDGVPKFMGGGGEGSDRAWQLDFRAAAVRRTTGGAGIVLLTATPAKNSPLEFYNLIQFIDPAAFTRAGIRDPEQFIDRFIKIEYVEVLDATFEVSKKSAVTGFMALDDLQTIILTYGEFRTAAEVGLKLPRPVVETITITMDDEQEAKYDEYVGQIEDILENPNPEGGQSYAILGLLARLSSVALHAALERGYTYKTALEGGLVKKRVWQDGEQVDVTIRLGRPSYESPKLTECAKRVTASPNCGHIIFCEPTAVHQWMREVLVTHGIPRERIAILNAEETAPADRIRIAREFNGLSSDPPPPGTCARPQDTTTTPKYDVVIANSVAYEGIDLQVRTCTIHHLDLPWTPADLEQRNGRAVRQGNTLGTVQIFYYFADGSTDGYRFSLINGKAGWLGQLLKSQVRDTNNPAAQQQLTPEDILLMISRNKEKTRALLEEKKKRQAEEARARIAKEAARLLRQAAGRFRDARQSADAEKAARLRDEGEQRLADLEQVSADAWPWAPWMYAVRGMDMIVPENGGAPVYEGLRVARPRAGAPDQLDYLEFGQIVSTEEGDKIGLRAAGSPSWQLVTYTGTLGGIPILVGELPRDGGQMWPDDDDTRTGAALEKKIEEVGRYGKFEQLGWRGASDAWLEKWWPRFEGKIAEGLAASYHREKVPVTDAEGLAIAEGSDIRGATIVPPTLAGWQRFLELAPRSGESYTTLKDIGLDWWGRKIPPNLLSSAKDKDAATEEDEEDEEDEADERDKIDQAVKTASDAEEKRMGERLRQGRDREEAAWSEAVRRGTEIEELLHGCGEGASRKAAIAALAKNHDAYEVSDLYDAARAAIKAIGLPVKKYAQYVKQTDAAIADGKSAIPIVERARKAAADGKSAIPIVERARKAANAAEASPAATGASAPSSSWMQAVADAFERTPGYRLDISARGQQGHVVAVYPEGAGVGDAVVSINLEGGEVEDVRWLSGRLTRTEQDEILDRLGAALKTGSKVEKGEPVSPIEDLIAMMERRGRILGADPAQRAKDPYNLLAQTFAELAEPSPSTPAELMQWLERADFSAAADLVSKFRSGDAPGDLTALANQLWKAAVGSLSVGSVRREGTVWRVPCESLYTDKSDGRVRLLARRLLTSGEYFLLPITVRSVQNKSEGGITVCEVDDEHESLLPTDTVYILEREPADYVELHTRIRQFLAEVERTPERLQDVRRLLYWTAAMIDTPRCQGAHRAAVRRALDQATGHYDDARVQLARGSSVVAFQRVHDALRRLSAAAATMAEACAEGQLPLKGPLRLMSLEPSEADTALLGELANSSAKLRVGQRREVPEETARPEPTPSDGADSTAAEPLTRPRMHPEDQKYVQAELTKHEAESRALSSEKTDRRVIENLLLQHTAKMDALGMVGASKKDRVQQGTATAQQVQSITVLRAEASVLRRRGYGVHYLEGKFGAVNAVGIGGQLLGVRLHPATPALWFASGLDPALEERYERDMREVQEVVQTFLREERARVGEAKRPWLDEPVMLAIWRRAREDGAPEASAAKESALIPDASKPSPSASVPGDVASRKRPNVPAGASATLTHHGDSSEPIARAWQVLSRAGINVDPAGLRVVGQLGECHAPNAMAREQARRALRDAGIHASLVRDRLLFPLRQP